MKLLKSYIDLNKERLLKAGTFKDSRGKTYRVDIRGTVTRTSPERPWRGKSERRHVLNMRRFFRTHPGIEKALGQACA